eukprot:g3086.t1
MADMSSKLAEARDTKATALRLAIDSTTSIDGINANEELHQSTMEVISAVMELEKARFFVEEAAKQVAALETERSGLSEQERLIAVKVAEANAKVKDIICSTQSLEGLRAVKKSQAEALRAVIAAEKHLAEAEGDLAVEREKCDRLEVDVNQHNKDVICLHGESMEAIESHMSRPRQSAAVEVAVAVVGGGLSALLRENLMRPSSLETLRRTIIEHMGYIHDRGFEKAATRLRSKELNIGGITIDRVHMKLRESNTVLSGEDSVLFNTSDAVDISFVVVPQESTTESSNSAKTSSTGEHLMLLLKDAKVHFENPRDASDFALLVSNTIGDGSPAKVIGCDASNGKVDWVEIAEAHQARRVDATTAVRINEFLKDRAQRKLTETKARLAKLWSAARMKQQLLDAMHRVLMFSNQTFSLQSDNSMSREETFGLSTEPGDGKVIVRWNRPVEHVLHGDPVDDAGVPIPNTLRTMALQWSLKTEPPLWQPLAVETSSSKGRRGRVSFLSLDPNVPGYLCSAPCVPDLDGVATPVPVTIVPVALGTDVEITFRTEAAARRAVAVHGKERGALTLLERASAVDKMKNGKGSIGGTTRSGFSSTEQKLRFKVKSCVDSPEWTFDNDSERSDNWRVRVRGLAAVGNSTVVSNNRDNGAAGVSSDVDSQVFEVHIQALACPAAKTAYKLNSSKNTQRIGMSKSIPDRAGRGVDETKGFLTDEDPSIMSQRQTFGKDFDPVWHEWAGRTILVSGVPAHVSPEELKRRSNFGVYGEIDCVAMPMSRKFQQRATFWPRSYSKKTSTSGNVKSAAAALDGTETELSASEDFFAPDHVSFESCRSEHSFIRSDPSGTGGFVLSARSKRNNFKQEASFWDPHLHTRWRDKWRFWKTVSTVKLNVADCRPLWAWEQGTSWQTGQISDVSFASGTDSYASPSQVLYRVDFGDGSVENDVRVHQLRVAEDGIDAPKGLDDPSCLDENGCLKIGLYVLMRRSNRYMTAMVGGNSGTETCEAVVHGLDNVKQYYFEFDLNVKETKAGMNDLKKGSVGNSAAVVHLHSRIVTPCGDIIEALKRSPINEDEVLAALDQGANPFATDKDGNNCLHLAVYAARPRIVRWLLYYGAVNNKRTRVFTEKNADNFCSVFGQHFKQGMKVEAYWAENDDRGDWEEAVITGVDKINGTYDVRYSFARGQKTKKRVPRSLIRERPGDDSNALPVVNKEHVRIRGLPYMVFRDETLSSYELIEDMAAFVRDAGGSMEKWPFDARREEFLFQEPMKHADETNGGSAGGPLRVVCPLWLESNRFGRTPLDEIRLLTLNLDKDLAKKFGKNFAALSTTKRGEKEKKMHLTSFLEATNTLEFAEVRFLLERADAQFYFSQFNSAGNRPHTLGYVPPLYKKPLDLCWVVEASEDCTEESLDGIRKIMEASGIPEAVATTDKWGPNENGLLQKYVLYKGNRPAEYDRVKVYPRGFTPQDLPEAEPLSEYPFSVINALGIVYAPLLLADPVWSENWHDTVVTDIAPSPWAFRKLMTVALGGKNEDEVTKMVKAISRLAQSRGLCDPLLKQDLSGFTVLHHACFDGASDIVMNAMKHLPPPTMSKWNDYHISDGYDSFVRLACEICMYMQMKLSPIKFTLQLLTKTKTKIDSQEEEQAAKKGGIGLAQHLRVEWEAEMALTGGRRFVRPVYGEMFQYHRLKELIAPDFYIEYRLVVRREIPASDDPANGVKINLVPSGPAHRLLVNPTWELHRLIREVSTNMLLSGTAPQLEGSSKKLSKDSAEDITALSAQVHLFYGTRELTKLMRNLRQLGILPKGSNESTNKRNDKETVYGLLVEVSSRKRGSTRKRKMKTPGWCG